MTNWTFVYGALATTLLGSGTVAAAEANETLTLRMAINPVILLVVTDYTLDMTAGDITVEDLDSTGLTRTEGRSEFYLAANTGYDITLAPEETWGAYGEAKVKFVGVGNSNNYIAGQLFLDTDMSTDARTLGDEDIVGWDSTAGLSAWETYLRTLDSGSWIGFARFLWILSGGTLIGPNDGTGNVTYTNPNRGVRRYGVGAIFDPQDWNGNAAEDLSGAPDGAASIAPPDVYSTTVTVTVSNI